MSVQFDYQGFDVNSQWDGALTSSTASTAYSTMAAAGANDIGISPKLYLATGTSSTLITDPVMSTSDANLIAGIKAAQAKGLKVLLEPHLLSLQSSSSGTFLPTDTTAFFASYKAAIVHLATIAQQTGVDTFSVGNEMSLLTGSAYRAQWLDIIASVRQVYSGKITYEAGTNEASKVSFWDKVDTIGFNAYLPLSASANPTVADLAKAWTAAPADAYWSSVLNGQSIVGFMQSLASTYGKRVLVTEVGYRSIEGSASNPGNSIVAGTPSEAAQANAYQALFQTMQQQGGTWFAGLNLWEYAVGNTDPTTNYSPLGKAAMSLVQNYFTGSAAVPGLAVNGSAVGDVIDLGAGDDTINAGLGNDIIKLGAGNDTVIAGPGQIAPLTSSTVTFTGYGLLGKDGGGAQVALMINGQQVGATATLTPAADATGYQTFSITFANPDVIKSLDLALLNPTTGAVAMIRGITVNGSVLSVSETTNISSPGTFNIYNKPIHLDATTHQDLFYGAQTDNDLIYAGSGNDTIDGGTGIDTVVFQGAMSAYSLARSGDRLIVTDSLSGTPVQDNLTNVEYLQFSDRTVAVAALTIPDVGTSTVTALMKPLMSSATLLAPSSGGLPSIQASGLTVAGATVTLASGSTVLGTTTADASGAYSFTVAVPAAGLYTVAAVASLGALSSAASDATILAVGSAATIVGLLTSTQAVAQAVAITDPSNPIVLSVAQLRSLNADLGHAVTGYKLVVADTAAHVMGALDLLGTQANLSGITLTDTSVFNVSQTAMTAMIANNQAVLSTITGGYSYAVTSANATATATASYDSSGALISTKVVTTGANTVETLIRAATGATSDVLTSLAGIPITKTTVDATGKHYTVYGITGKPYAVQDYIYDASGKLRSLTQSYANGSIYSTLTAAADGTATTLQYDTTGHLVQKVIAAPSGSTDTATYDASGAVLTDTLVNASGKQITLNGIAGKPYVSQVLTYDPTGKLTAAKQYTAGGGLYATITYAADGTTTTLQYDSAGHLVQKLVASPNGATDTATYATSGAVLTDTLVSTGGKQVTINAIAGKPYVTQVSSYDPTGKLTAVKEYAVGGGLYATITVAADGTATTLQYDSAGHLTNRIVASPNGSTDTSTYDSSGAVLTDTLVNASGKQITLNGIAGKPYVSQLLTYDPTGKLTLVKEYTAGGGLYATIAYAADGTATTLQYDSAGHLVQKLVASPNGATDTATYAASGAVLTDTVVTSAGKQVTLNGITGKPYVTQVSSYDATGKLTAVKDYAAGGGLYAGITYAADGTATTLQYDATGHLAQKLVASPNGATDTATYATSGAMLTDTLVTSSGRQMTLNGITGKPYVTQVYSYDPTGRLTTLNQYYAGGALYSSATFAADGTSTTMQYDTAGHLAQKVIAAPSGATDTATYSTAGVMLTDKVVDAAGGRHTTTYGITGKPYTSQLIDADSTGKSLDGVNFNVDGSRTTTFLASGVTMTFANAHDTIGSLGGETMIFGSTPFSDTITGFHGGDAAGHDTIVLPKALATGFGQLGIATAGQTTTIQIDSKHAIALTSPAGGVTASDFKFV